ncbi:MAG: M1 family metallopeptidase [Desulfobacterales bacterium]|jgi:tricorn protease interacting factor F2/3
MQDFRPQNYRIHLIPDLKQFTFAGNVTLAVEASTAIEVLRLNILELDIRECAVGQSNEWIDCRFESDAEKEELQIHLPRKMDGAVRIQIRYDGQINDKMAGFYRSQYSHSGKNEYIAVTQFEESDARRAFPCMDHPAQKATFDISLDIDSDKVAISNSAIKEETPLADGKKRVTFEQTPKMSTYLVFFGVGAFEFSRDTEDPRVRVATLPGMKPYANFGLEFGRKALAFSEDYYSVPYPLPKMDLIAIPDFAFGAMENWGAITFRENLLLYYPEITSKSGQERICEVIAHEIAHQWFGNLVTPSDWQYLWLNESFATYFGNGVVAHYYPQWETWQQFLWGNTGSAMARDALLENFAIEIPGGEHVVINVSTAPIIYSKGGSILRQVEGYIGPQNFKRGLRHYLKTYQYANAASQDLWNSLEKVSEQPIADMMKSWIEQAGFPMISVKQKDNKLHLEQQRFSYLPADSDQQWQVPISIQFFSGPVKTERLTFLMNSATHEIDFPDQADGFKVNDQQTGFYIVRYRDEANLATLGQRAAEQTLSPEDRWGLQNDLFSLCKRGDVPFDAYLDFLGHYRDERAFLPLVSISNHLQHAYLVLDAEKQQKIASLVRPWFENVLSDIGFEPDSDEKHTTAILREQSLWHAALSGSESAIEFGVKQFADWMKGKTVHPDIMKSVLQIAAFTGDQQTFAYLDERFVQSQVEHERMNILVALGCFKEKEPLENALQYILDTVPGRNKFVPVVAMAANPHAIALLWDWYVSNLEQIEQFHPMLYERVVASIVPVAGMDHPQTVKDFFADYMQKTDKASDVIKLSLEKLDINLRMRAAN